MKLEDQVCSLELAKKMKGLGFKQESLFYWGRNGKELFARTGIDDTTFGYTTLNAEGAGGDPYWFDESELDEVDWYSAYTVAELGERLPSAIEWLDLEMFKREEGSFLVRYVNEDGAVEFSESALKEADARAKMLIYIAENKLRKPQND